METSLVSVLSEANQAKHAEYCYCQTVLHFLLEEQNNVENSVIHYLYTTIFPQVKLLT